MPPAPGRLSMTNCCLSRTLSLSSTTGPARSEEHTSELQSHLNLVCRLLLEKKKLTHSDAQTRNIHPFLIHRQAPKNGTEGLPRAMSSIVYPITHKNSTAVYLVSIEQSCR